MKFRILLPIILLAQLTVGSIGIASDVYSFRPGPSFRTATPSELFTSAIEQERLAEEARNRNLGYSLLALLGGVILFVGLGPLIRQAKKIPKVSGDIVVTSAAGAIKAKRRFAQKVEDKINSSSTEE